MMGTATAGAVVPISDARGSQIRTTTHESSLLLSSGPNELGHHIDLEHGTLTFATFATMGVVTLVRYISECERQMVAVKKAFLWAGGAKAFFLSLHSLDEVPATHASTTVEHDGTVTEHSLLAGKDALAASDPSHLWHHSRRQGSSVTFQDLLLQDDPRSRSSSRASRWRSANARAPSAHI